VSGVPVEGRAGVNERKPCPFCGEVHQPGPVGIPGSAFAGIEILVCPNIPDGHIYMDDQPKVGPRGALFRIGDA
jgi:hypothetical protein